MSEISVYQLTATPLERALPKLLEKIVESGKRAVVLAQNSATIQRLDEVLWTYTTKNFLPHGTSRDGYKEEQPIYLTTEEENPNEAECLVVLEGATPNFLAGFNRVLDIFNGNDAEEAKAAKARVGNYKALPNTQFSFWQQDIKGAWQKNAAPVA